LYTTKRTTITIIAAFLIYGSVFSVGFVFAEKPDPCFGNDACEGYPCTNNPHQLLTTCCWVMFNVNTCQDCYIDPLTNDFGYCGLPYTLRGYDINGIITPGLHLRMLQHQQQQQQQPQKQKNWYLNAFTV
jgi:hypothetical protein